MIDIPRNFNNIKNEVIDIVETRFRTISKAINLKFWGLDSDYGHSLFVGSYGRGTAIDTSDVDMLVELPVSEKYRVDQCKNNSQSYLLQIVKDKILETYPRSDIHADGQVVIVNFSDGIIFEIVPVFEKTGYWGEPNGYVYPDSNHGGRWQSTNPKEEQDAMSLMNNYSHTNGLLKDTCRFLRFIRTEYYSSYHLSGILIDSFVYWAIDGWHFLRQYEKSINCGKTFVEHLNEKYNGVTYGNFCLITLHAPGSGMVVSTKEWEVLGKVLRKLVE